MNPLTLRRSLLTLAIALAASGAQAPAGYLSILPQGVAVMGGVEQH